MNKKILIVLFSFLLLTGQIFAEESSSFKDRAKFGAYVPEHIVDEAYQKGHDAGFISGIVSKNVITETFNASEDVGFSIGKWIKREVNRW